MTTFAVVSKTPTEVLPADRPASSAACFREQARTSDREAVRRITQSTGFFSAEEVDVAVELIDDRLHRGDLSDYHFVFADVNGETIGYACHGEIECTAGSHDLYWIAVRDDQRGGGLGRQLMSRVEKLIAQSGGRRLYIDTSLRAQYEPTRRFYERCGYRAEATLADFYGPGDSKVIMSKVIG